MQFDDWLVKGPRTIDWCLRYLNQQPGGPVEHHHIWKRMGNLTSADFGVAEREHIMEALRHAATYDQLHVVSSASFEVLLRRAQTTEYARQERTRDVAPAKGGQKPAGAVLTLTVEEQDAFARSTRSGVSMICPHLLDRVKEDVAR